MMNRLVLGAKCLLLLYLLTVSVGVSFAAEPVFFVENQMAGNAKGVSVGINPSIGEILNIGSEVSVPLPDGRMALGKVTGSIAGGGISLGGKGALGRKSLVITLLDNAGSLHIVKAENRIVGLELFDASNSAYYRSDIDSAGRGMLLLEDANAYQCVDFPEAPDSAVQIPLAKSPDGLTTETLTPDVSTLKTLQSRPGAPYVIYIDYWGGTLSGTAWNNNFNSGNDIVYTPYSYDSDSSTFSAADRYRMWLGWREVAEDYAPFNVNVTTDVAVFNATPNNRKVRNIATDTNYFYPGAGGVAYVGVFGRSDTYYQVSWSWNDSATSLGMTISHEVGHQMGLSHDGTSSSAYYTGHGDWGPIMGAPFGKKYVQFSKGEYPDANQFQDDLAIVRSDLSLSSDEAGDSNASALTLTLPVTDLEGVVSPAGLGSDIDVYKFSLGSQQQVDLSVAPLLADENDDLGTNLSIQASLVDDAGTVIAQAGGSGIPTMDILTYSDQLDAGTYYIRIKGLSYNGNWSGGFGEYGNGGWYRISVSGSGSSHTFDDVPPGYWAFNEIEKLVAEGVTTGCSAAPPLYCPDAEVTRAQMAIFLLRSKHGASYVPPPATGTMFSDVSSTYWAAAWIEQLANEGITAGCGNGKYCPDAPVTRDQMAVFILRTEHGSGYTPPSATGIFEDVPVSYWAASWIEQLYSEGITGGCSASPLRYCPTDPVSRAQMAVFLVRTFFPLPVAAGLQDGVYPEGAHQVETGRLSGQTDL